MLLPQQVWAESQRRPWDISAIHSVEQDWKRVRKLQPVITCSVFRSGIFGSLLGVRWYLVHVQVEQRWDESSFTSLCEYSLSVPKLIWIILKGCFPSVCVYNLAELRTGWFHAWFDPVTSLTKGLEINSFIFIPIIRSHLPLSLCTLLFPPKGWFPVYLRRLEYNHQA